MKTLAIAACFQLAFLQTSLAQEQAQPSVEISGRIVPSGKISPDKLSRLPSVDQEVRYQTSKGEEHGRYSGPLVWSILKAKGIANLPGHNEQLKHSFVVEGRDGYRIIFSVGEIDPNFGNAPIQLAIEHDGKPMTATEGYRLIVPGDKRGARFVRDVVKIDVQ
ncbi:hypothetical protein [Mesorhizobium sp. SP-1A]|uniref:hypothetical protein n=1 Tax=Mesorhizobium sp. SP-1A TaxID=3077840 RepID=UPI0028F6D5C5|nr:hypothetical protein [Mesorhizobium sp. SP-1A]